jgi:ribosomal protein S18 acetylase RimI-like enzyme
MFFIESVESVPMRRKRLDLFDDSGFTVGCVKVERPANDMVYLYALWVLKKYRRRGYAKMLLKKAVDDAKKTQGVLKITINACPFGDDEGAGLEALEAIYRSLGFRVFNRAKGTYNMVMDLGQTHPVTVGQGQATF